jgi:hypothetical protein
MTAKEIQKVVQDTEKELEQKEKEIAISKIKEVVKKTLEALEKCKKEKDEVEKRIKYLRMDLEDLKEGKLDRIEERQAKDPEAKKNTVIVIIKEKEIHHHHDYNPWYWPYTITIQNPVWYHSPTIPNYTYCESISNSSCNTLSYNATTCTSNNAIAVNCSLAKDYSAGTYDIEGKIINFR